jgi:hypothetical protein
MLYVFKPSRAVAPSAGLVALLFARTADPGGKASDLARPATGASTRDRLMAHILAGATGADAEAAAGTRLDETSMLVPTVG